uniref:izumo sperm-egg fusion protein 1 isoform X1 n=1 Tax=Doryrhamphus excisus TaxID=161450 RepID=UPI0025AE8637|nr:izumo sperm-egg fusion protein 1 isoform X1 [Doryrhamphus excisus]XP_057926148.1 izumo sperm-egg fusion protein 1 isoform X1 [Doryrhamphus excisus]XP_057926149.1 izumo sperm-egg fusion protein 1 isoform X1 [Doryrhamphus excisus]XP_057926150.1 izumo sperm-egg fusion protein 1 isoform X1 [Doryrhamphus excisus]
MLMMMLGLILCCAIVTEACLQCDRSIRNMHIDFTLHVVNVRDQVNLKTIMEAAHASYKEESQKKKGVIDPSTLYKAKTEYQNEFKHFLKQQQRGSITSEAIQIMNKGKEILKKHLDTFIREGLCPNKCGLLNRRVMDCITCKYKMYSCPSPSGQEDCGEYQVKAEEEGQAVLDCYQPWHSLLLGSREYHYSWAAGVPKDKKLSESDFKDLVVMEDSFMVLNQLQLDDQGTYQCSLQGKDGTKFYQVRYLLTVTPKPTEITRPVMTLPSLSPDDDESFFQSSEGVLVPLMATVTALSLAGCLVFAFVLGKMIIKKHTTDNGEESGGRK